jgi:uncharacterized protein
LEKLYPNEAGNYQDQREAIENGYEYEYSDIFVNIYSDENALSSEDCREVYDILIMYSKIKNTYDSLSDKSGIEDWQIVFSGFDGNSECEQIGYVRYLVDKKSKFSNLNRGDNFDSHMPILKSYRQMLEVWKKYERKQVLSKDELMEILKAFKQN